MITNSNCSNCELCGTKEISSQTVSADKTYRDMFEINIRKTRLPKRLVSFVKNSRPKYNRYWEHEAEELYNESTDEDADELIQEQVFLNARGISMSNFDAPTFPWHNHSLEEFTSLNEELQLTLNFFQNCNDDKTATQLMRKHREVYFAYYRNPIRVITNGDGYELLRDGRHRLWAAQLNNSIIPVWVVTYERPRSVSIEEYKKIIAYGDWRFENHRIC